MAKTKEQIIEDFKALSAEDQKEVQNAIYKRPDEQFDRSDIIRKRLEDRINTPLTDEEMDEIASIHTRF